MSSARLPTPLVRDQRGAMLVTGLFMACFLIGALWYLMGIGEAIVFRDRMQEAADHAAFTSAALHAKGMNFIAACNIVMLVLVFVHIVLGIIHDFALAACILSVGAGCGAWATARDVYTGYSKFFKPALTVIHDLEVVAGYGYPWLGTVKAYRIGGSYGNKNRIGDVHTLALSTSLLPGDLYGTEKPGLPLKPKTFAFLCEKLGNVVFDWAKEHVKLPGLGVVGSVVHWITGGDTVEGLVKKVIGATLTLRYCNDLGTSGRDDVNHALDEQLQKGMDQLRSDNEDTASENQANGRKPGDPGYEPPIKKPRIGGHTTQEGTHWQTSIDPGLDRGWAGDGPLVVRGGAFNGSEQMKVWALNLNPRYRDTEERRVMIASRQVQSAFVDTYQGPSAYYAEAEFYYDCTERWSDDECNGQGFQNDSNTMFAIKWRARLRRFEAPDLGKLVATFSIDAITGTDEYQDARTHIEDGDALGDLLHGGPLVRTTLELTMGGILRELEGQVFGEIRDAASTSSEPSGSYH